MTLSAFASAVPPLSATALLAALLPALWWPILIAFLLRDERAGGERDERGQHQHQESFLH